MSDLEKYLMELRNEMNSDEPESGHMKRFSEKLNKKDQKIRRIAFRHAIQIAASLAIILASGVVIIKSSKGSSKVALSPVVEEFQEARSFFIQQVDNRYEDISDLQFDSEKEKELLLEELSEMDKFHKNLLKELEANPGDERVMNALINHYQIKLQVMDQIIEQLVQIRNNNIKENEKSTI